MIFILPGQNSLRYQDLATLLIFTWVTTRNFSGKGRESFLEQKHFDKEFINNTWRKGPTAQSFRDFSPIYC